MSDSAYMQQRRQLLAAITEAFREDPDWDGCIVSGFALVVEFTGMDGDRDVAARSSDAAGETDLTPWAAHGLVSYALEDGKFDVDEADDDEEE